MLIDESGTTSDNQVMYIDESIDMVGTLVVKDIRKKEKKNKKEQNSTIARTILLKNSKQ